jgi:NADH-quinone oxidoreductase subunit A
MIYLSLLIYFLMVIGFAVTVVFLSHRIGEYRPLPKKLEAFECGIPPTGDARIKFDIQFYLVGLFFLIFDVEVAFIYAWAVAFWDLELPGLIYITVFIVVLLLGLAYIWKKGGLDWKPRTGIQA